MKTINRENLNDILNIIIYESYIDLNKFLDADNVYNFIKSIFNKGTSINLFLDYIYENKLINYTLDIDDIKLFNDTVYNNLIIIANKIINNEI